MSKPTKYTGSSLGLPRRGKGSLATWNQRIGALIIDWAASMVVAVAIFGWGVMNESGWRSFMIMAVFFVQSCLLSVLTGATFGQLLAGIGVMRIDGGALGWWRPILRTVMKCVVIPVVVVGAERRHLADMVLGTAVVRRRD